MSLTRSQGLGLDFGTSSSVLFFRWLHHDLHPLSVLLGQQGFDALDEQMEGILLIVRLCLRQKQKLLRFERFSRGAIADPMFLKAQQCEEGRDHGNDNAKNTDRDLVGQRIGWQSRIETELW
jgi:hypothetical protein